MSKSALLCLSGGVDSATLLAEYIENISCCVFFNYGSKQNKIEIRYARELAERFDRKLVEINARPLFEGFKSALMEFNPEEIESGAYSSEKECNAVVPGRNLIFASILGGLAQSKGLEKVYLGIHSGDHMVYADCRPGFVNALNKTFEIVFNGKVYLETPYIYNTKKLIARKAAFYGLSVLTYSCYRGNEIHCGTCPTCIERKQAFGKLDKTIYKE